MQRQTKSNGHSTNRGNSFENLKIKHNVAEYFKAKANESGLGYSEYLKELMKKDYYDNLLDNPQFKNTMDGLVNYIARRSREPPLNKTTIEQYQ